jgi:all-trans-retinol dehydrogenase (NAD+)
MSRIAGATALVTGAAAGIGLLVGERLLRRGAARLVMWDVRGDVAQEAAAALREGGHRVHAFAVDVTDRRQVEAVLHQMQAEGVAIDILVNNAGVVRSGDFAVQSVEDIDVTMAVNALAPMRLTRAVLPGMVERGRGHIVNIASAASLLSNPGMAVYCGSKWAVAGWSDSVRLELERSRSGVRVTTVMPYYVDTGMFAGVRSRVLPILRPERVAQDIVHGIETDRLFVRLPRLLGAVPLLRGALPVRWFDRVAGDWFGIYRSMDSFRGRGG